jgi:hypothetical protein
MLNLSRPSSVLSIFFSLLVSMAGSAAIGQTTTQNTALDRQLSRLDLGVIAVAVLNKDSNGTATVNGVSNTPVNLNPSNTVGPVVTLRYVVSPLVGFELNYGYARYTQTFTPFGALSNAGVQQNASEGILRRNPICLRRSRYDCLPADSRRRRRLDQSGSGCILLLSGSREDRILSTLRTSRTIPSALLSRTRLRDQLPDDQAAHLNV